jgi:preprotein translocase subunit Sss1
MDVRKRVPRARPGAHLRQLVTWVHQDLLGREPDEEGMAYWVGVLGEGLPFETMYTTIRDCEERRILAVRDWHGLITAVHEDLLGRGADKSALAYWSQALRAGVKFEAMYEAVRQSDERKSLLVKPDLTELIKAVHLDLLGRPPDESALAYWADALRTGVKFEAMFVSIRQSEERKSLLERPDWSELIKAVHLDLLGRPADENALAYWSDALRTGVKFEAMYESIRQSEERKSLLERPDWSELIKAVHVDILGRSPDETAAAYWSDALRKGMKFEAMYEAVRQSEERRSLVEEADWSDLIETVHMDLLGRPPDESAATYWADALRGGLRFEEMYKAVSESDEHRAASKLFVYPGHYYSPIVNPALIEKSEKTIFDFDRKLPGINLNSDSQIELLGEIEKQYGTLPFEEEPTEQNRYYYNNLFFRYSDAITLFCFIMKFQPGKIIEVGSGYSSAVILDALDFAPELKTQCLFIEPNIERLESLLRETDKARVEILPHFVQDIDISRFDQLRENDILFIDSTHVVKTGSDVLYHITNILPNLRPGVLIHFHDIFYPFEYPRDWVMDDNRSWNEIYFLQAFLMNNDQYEIVFFNDYMQKLHGDQIRGSMPKFMKAPGGSLWLRKVAPPA